MSYEIRDNATIEAQIEAVKKYSADGADQKSRVNARRELNASTFDINAYLSEELVKERQKFGYSHVSAKLLSDMDQNANEYESLGALHLLEAKMSGDDKLIDLAKQNMRIVAVLIGKDETFPETLRQTEAIVDSALAVITENQQHNEQLHAKVMERVAKLELIKVKYESISKKISKHDPVNEEVTLPVNNLLAANLLGDGELIAEANKQLKETLQIAGANQRDTDTESRYWNKQIEINIAKDIDPRGQIEAEGYGKALEAANKKKNDEAKQAATWKKLKGPSALDGQPQDFMAKYATKSDKPPSL